jgi:hypothetical protein
MEIVVLIITTTKTIIIIIKTTITRLRGKLSREYTNKT